MLDIFNFIFFSIIGNTAWFIIDFISWGTPGKIIRIILFLHNQEPGQQLWIKNKLCVGLAGTYYGWGREVLHMAANLSVTNRYTLQITGIQDARL